MGGFYKFRESDVEGLTLMLSHIPQQSFDRRCRMALTCLANTWADPARCPVPFFSLGQRTLAERTGETARACQKFFEQMERDGWIVRVGTETNRGGRFVLRTFSWMAESEGVKPQHEEKGFEGVKPSRVAPLAESPAKRVAPVKPYARKKGCTSELSEESSEGGGSPAGAGTPPADALTETLARLRAGEDVMDEWHME